jgi:hypothetical protein
MVYDVTTCSSKEEEVDRVIVVVVDNVIGQEKVDRCFARQVPGRDG